MSNNKLCFDPVFDHHYESNIRQQCRLINGSIPKTVLNSTHRNQLNESPWKAIIFVKHKKHPSRDGNENRSEIVIFSH